MSSSLSPSTIYLSFSISWQFVGDADLMSRKRWGKNLRHGEVKWLARGNKAARWTSDLRSSLQGLSKVLTSPNPLQVLVHTSHQPSEHLILASCPLLLSVPHMSANGLFTLASHLDNILPIPFSLPAVPKASFSTRREGMAPCHLSVSVSYCCCCTTHSDFCLNSKLLLSFCCE